MSSTARRGPASHARTITLAASSRRSASASASSSRMTARTSSDQSNGFELTSTRASTRSGAVAAASSAARPPNDVPTSAARSPGNAPSTTSTSAPSCQSSGATTRCRGSSSGRTRCHSRGSPTPEWRRTTSTNGSYPAERVVVRTLWISLLAALFFAPQALAQEPPARLLMPGVTYSKRVQFTPHGPVVLNVITAPKPGGLYSLQPVLSNEAIVGREKVTDMERRVSPTATVAGINGDLFDAVDGHPSGVVIRNRVLDHPPLSDRTSIGIGADGLLHLDTVSMLGYWRGTGQRLRLTLNDPPATNGYALFTRAYGPVTPTLTSGA